jgi:tetratricopeptide (TPR) repeat protein
MSFWNLVNELDSDLALPQDLSPTIESGKAIVQGVLVGAAGAAIVGAFLANDMVSFSSLGRILSSGQQHANSVAEEAVSRRDAANATNASNRAMRKQSGLIFLERAAAQPPYSASISWRLALAYLANQQPNKARKIIEEALTTFPDDADVLLTAAYLYVRQAENSADKSGLYARAIGALERAQRLRPADYDVCCSLARILSKDGQEDEAIARWREASLIDDRAALGWFQEAEFHKKHGRYLDARKCYDAAHERDNTISLPWAIEYQNGENDLAKDNLPKALAHFEEAHLLNPQWDRPFWGKALHSIRGGDFRAALSFLESAIALNPTDAQLRFTAGNMAQRLNIPELAHQHWMDAFHLDEDTLVPWVISLRAGQQALAAKEFETAANCFGEADKLHGSWDKARSLCKAALNAQQAQKLNREAETAAYRGNMNDAEGLWRAAIELDNTLGNAYMKLGAIAADRGNTSEALELFNRAAVLSQPLAQKALALCSAYHNFDPQVGPS